MFSRRLCTRSVIIQAQRQLSGAKAQVVPAFASVNPWKLSKTEPHHVLNLGKSSVGFKQLIVTEYCLIFCSRWRVEEDWE